ncbi:MAG: aminoglycoside phosphotransferase family protein [Phycisphaerales bacterium]|nr:aminoglycoside phosphotransferase family protein [Phycisphaerales bacterium]
MSTRPLIRQLAELELTPDDAQGLGLTSRRAVLRRAWPRSGQHLLLEYATEKGEIVPGQWMSDQRALHQVASETRQRCPQGSIATANIGEHVVLLQTRGADRALTSIPKLLHNGSELISHRPERRAVVRLGPASAAYAKVVRSSAFRRLADSSQLMCGVSDRSGCAFDAPEVLDCHEDDGVLVLSALEGDSLNDLNDSAGLIGAMRAAGELLRFIHGMHAPAWARPHSARSEVELLLKWRSWLQSLNAEICQHSLHAIESVVDALLGDETKTVLLHRDFYDKQIIVAPSGRIGILDFDTLAVGEPALDIGNMLAHLELRAVEQWLPASAATSAAAAFLDGYGISSVQPLRVQAYLDSARLRLAFVYSLRPQWGYSPGTILEHLGEPHLCFAARAE